MFRKPDIKQAILTTASGQGEFKTICPSEIARSLFPQNWQNHMAGIRGVAIELYNEGKVIISPKGVPVDNGYIKGPIRIGISPAGNS